ncbi:translation elongation factor Ts [Candidatus Pelagibacter communis]|uniref:translation elongation factor Ts n=1 Tax=Pelagibacter ubique TaxID=198252 RepID=UPI00094CE5DF|nr:translation elongation factor Ts [Candidatus Pelagibacter ubique]
MSDLESVKKLRNSTGAGFKDCNQALKESGGNLEKAIEILRIKGVSKASKKMSREANEGLVSIFGDEKKSSIIEINCETDFVAKNDDFLNFVDEISELNHSVNSDQDKLKNTKMKNGKIVSENLVSLISKIGEKITIGRSKTLDSNNGKNYTYNHTIIRNKLSKLAVIVSLEMDKQTKEIDSFGKQLSMHIAASNPLVIESQNLKDEIIAKEKDIIDKELKETGKPQEILEKIAQGKLNKFKDENSLLSQFWVMDPKKKVKDILNEFRKSNIKIKDFYRIKIGE